MGIDRKGDSMNDFMKKGGRRCAARRRRRCGKAALIVAVIILATMTVSLQKARAEVEEPKSVLSESALAAMENESFWCPGNANWWAETYPEYADHFLNPEKYIEARKKAAEEARIQAEMEAQENELAE